jgi:hypothetical protein
VLVTLIVVAGILILFKLIASIPKVSVIDIIKRIARERSVLKIVGFIILGIFQLLRKGIWLLFPPVAIAMAGIAVAACGGTDTAKYIFCFAYECLERWKPTGRIHPLCM